MTERTCPTCGDAYAYRVPKRYADQFGVTNEYRHHRPGDPYVYFHEIPAEQVVDIAYGEEAT